MKNEAPFLLEWVAYHRVIGFDEIVICSNPSNDGTEELLAALAGAGVIRHLQAVPEPGEAAQSAAAKRFSAEIGYRDGDWYLWLDADEFLNIHVGARRVEDLIEAVGAHDCALINWRVFGANGHARFPGRFIGPGFGRAARRKFAGNDSVKSFFRMSPKLGGFAPVGIHRPLVTRGGGLRHTDVVTGCGTNPKLGFRPHWQWLQGDSFPANSKVEPGEVGWELAQVNHYMVRTPDYFALKRLRGRGWKADSEAEANQRHTDGFFTKNDRNEEEDASIQAWEAAVTEEMARLAHLPAVGAALARSEVLTASVFAELEAMGGLVPIASSKPAAAPALPFPPKVASLVQRMYETSSVILEYGSGEQTRLAARLGKRVRTVESDRIVADRFAKGLAETGGDAILHHVDLGPTGTFGTPTDPKFHRAFHSYPLSVWDRPDLGDPDLVLIDGRFRAACLVAVMLRAKSPTTLLFDDYEDRPYYHRVEALAQKVATVGRMARFLVTPGPIPSDMVTEVIGWFSDPR
ncbi:MAG: glycosyltransferase family 2 protein [Tabrizicola sp.]|nr:glycosyltransferase family 2 protein [Tabrizicola sp.]